MQCSKCQAKIPAARLRALPNTKTCVECSSVERNYVRTIISGKTTYSEWEVIKNKETKRYLEKLDSKGRQGFGSMLYRASKRIPEPKASEMSKAPKRAMRTLPEFSQSKFESVLKDAMEWIDTDKQYAIDKIEKAYKNEMISGINRRYAIEIIEKLKPEPKKIKKKVEQEAVDDEIMHAFRNWRM